jgi:glutathione S-transferase
MLTLYDDLDSGNGYKVRLLLALLGRSYRLVELDIDHGATRTPEFLAKNPNGKIPLLELPDGSVLAESNAILVYLAQGTRFWPQDPWEQALVLQWMFFEQYSHEPNVATPRHWIRHGLATRERAAALIEKQEKGRGALTLLDRHLEGRDWLVGRDVTVADLCLYADTHVADQAGLPLHPHPHLRAWIDRVAALPGYAPLDAPERAGKA